MPPSPKVHCNGRGANGDHCCYIAGQVCEFLDVTGDVPRCSIWNVNMKKSSRWRKAPVGVWMSDRYPGFDCKDWPQNIPADETSGAGLCCWSNT